MFNSTLTGNARVWFDDLPPEAIDSYDDLKKAFLENYLQQKKCIKDPKEIHNIKQREGESTEDFVKRYKMESRDVKGAPECMRISGFVHGITNPELIKRLHDKILKTKDLTILIRSYDYDLAKPKTILRGKWQPQITNGRKRFHHGNNMKAAKSKISKKEVSGTNKVRHNTDECMHLKKQIEEMLKAGKLSHLIKELKQNNRKEQPKVVKKGETSGKDKASSSPYNGIIGIPGVRKLQEVLSTAHGMLKISVEGGVITLKSSKLVLLECAMVSEPEGAPSATKPIIEERVKPADMTGVPRHITEHCLNVREGCSSVRQKKRGQAADRNQAIQEEVGKLVEA
ncbi:reverse transcriptase domain-containing protein [Tanacetum coccineum]